jgi:hypothetical protein
MTICNDDHPFNELHDVLQIVAPPSLPCETIKEVDLMCLKVNDCENPVDVVWAMDREDPSVFEPIRRFLHVPPEVFIIALVPYANEIVCREDRATV